MSRKEHPLLPEDLMAYIDGELPADQAAIAAKHIESCLDCSQTIADTGRLSHEMAAWQVEEPAPGLTNAVMAEAERRRKETDRAYSRSTWWGSRRVWVYGLAGSFAALLLAVLVMTPSVTRYAEDESAAVAEFGDRPRGQFEGRLETNRARDGAETPPAPGAPAEGEYASRAKELQEGGGGGGGGVETLRQQMRQIEPADAGPMIIRTVHLNILTKEFDKARSAIDTIVRNAKGYIEQLQVRGEIGSGRALSATLRMPVDRLDPSLTELRKLGHVQNESQNSSDVSSQYIDLEARLKNARNTEERFLRLLRERTGNLKDVVEAEREIARVREQIEVMDAQLKSLSKKVALATIQVELTEEFRANLEPTLPSTGTRLANAAVNGYKRAVETVIGFITVILLFGPTVLLLVAILTVVGLVAWRYQKRQARRSLPS